MDIEAIETSCVYGICLSATTPNIITLTIETLNNGPGVGKLFTSGPNEAGHF
jgi:hypothetical protein